VKDRDFTTELPGAEIFDPEEEAKLQEEVERIAAEFPRFSLADIRNGLGVSQAELANRMSVAPEKVAEIENKGINVSVWEVLQMLNCLGCELEMHAELDGKKMDLKFPSGKGVDELT
jgi:DNA-binding transcriptional regulator YiaG